jgi:hypothetical protein
MATKAEQYRSEAQRTGRGGRGSTKKPRKAEWSRDKAHARSKATHALEEVPSGRPSRKSTRASANRAKADSAMNVTQETRMDAPPATARRERARSTRVRGS